MAALNEAWRVLQDPGRRARYDARLRAERAAGAARPGGQPTVPLVDPARLGADPAGADPGVQLVRGLPWLVLVGLLAVVFVFTAYAARPGRLDEPTTSTASTTSTTLLGGLIELGTCVTVPSDPQVLVPVPCAGPYDGRVAATAPLGEACPAGTEPWVAQGAPVKLCVSPR